MRRLYLWLLIWIFPSMVSAKGLNELIGAMPDSVKKSLVWKVRFKT